MTSRPLHFALVCLLASVIAVGAQAQLAGTDTSPGDSCATVPQGAARMTASPSGDGTQITLICDGAVWQRKPASAAGNDREIQFNSAGLLYGVPNFSYGTDARLTRTFTDTGTAAEEILHNEFASTVSPSANQNASRKNIAVAGITKADNLGTTVGEINGVVGWAEAIGSSNVEKSVGVVAYNRTGTSGGTIDHSAAIDVYNWLEFGNVATLYGASIYWQVEEFTTANSVYGLYIGGTNYGTVSGTAYGIYQDGNYDNFFAGRVGLNTWNPTYRLQLPNTASNGGGRGIANSWATYSDGRFKTNVLRIDDALSKVTQIEGVTYLWHGQENDNREAGFIAQDVRAVLPEAVSVGPGGGKNEKGEDVTVEDYHSIDYGRLTPLLVEAIKELKAQNDDLRARIERLEATEE